MRRVIISREDELDTVEVELDARSSALHSHPLEGGHILVFGSPDFVAVYDSQVRAAAHMLETKDMLRRALDENRLLCEALTRAQSRCNELLTENRSMKAKYECR